MALINVLNAPQGEELLHYMMTVGWRCPSPERRGLYLIDWGGETDMRYTAIDAEGAGEANAEAFAFRDPAIQWLRSSEANDGAAHDHDRELWAKMRPGRPYPNDFMYD